MKNSFEKIEFIAAMVLWGIIILFMKFVRFCEGIIKFVRICEDKLCL